MTISRLRYLGNFHEVHGRQQVASASTIKAQGLVPPDAAESVSNRLKADGEDHIRASQELYALADSFELLCQGNKVDFTKTVCG